ncbi:MAG: TonB-dependent receptor [Acidobacteria bacterium]|nr:TonB-dependent receptor [Acidobacteriota bacterium]
MSSPEFRFPGFLAWLVLACLSLLQSATGQSTGGRIIGRVSDPTGAVVAGVTVTLTNEATGISTSTQTNDTGDYTFVEVAPASYRVEYALRGFKKYVRSNVVLELNQVLTLNASLQPGAAQETVEVSSQAPLVETSSTQLGTVVNERAIVQLPLNERDTYQFLSLQPGVQSQVGADLYYGGSSTGSVSVNGGRGRANNFSVNGGDANDMFANLPTVQPSPDSVEEFRVLTNGFDAEFGRNSGSVVNVVTKSGTNQVHGDIYEFHRNRPLNARNYLDPPGTKEPFILNQFGGTIGGPLKRDRTFYFGSYDGRRRIRGVSSGTVTIPTAAESTGVFAGPFTGSVTNPFVGSVLQGRPGCSQAIANNGGSIPDPTVASNYPVSWNTLFPQDVNGNTTIPLPCQDPVAVDLLNQYVSPYIPQANNGLLVTVLSERDRQDQGTFRFDHRINDKQNFSAYYYLTDETDFNPFNTFQAAGANMPGFGDSVKQRFQQYNLSHTWTISSTLVNEARFTYMREGQRTFGHSQHTNLVTNSCVSPAAQPFCFTGVSDSSAVPSLPRLGITPGLGPNREGVPDIAISGGFTIGNNFEGELPQVGNSFQWSDSITKVKGNHTFKFGADARRMRFDQTLYFEVNGYYNYFGTGVNTTGFSDLYPDYLLGLPDQYQQGAAQVENVRETSFYSFAQDSWKIRPNLTLNYGLRWEYNSPLTDIGHHVQTFRAGQNTTVYPCQLSAYSVQYFQSFGVANPDCNNTGVFPTGLVVPGDKGVPPGLTQNYYKAFAPRVGIAWSPGRSGKTSIRAGWGMFYNPIEQLVLEQFSAEPPFGGSTLIFGTLFNTPFYAQSNFQFPNAFNPQGGEFTGIQNPKPGQPVDWSLFRPILLFGEFQPHMRTQYSDQYNFTIQRELASNLVLQLGYVGSQGHRLLGTTDLNRATPQTCLDIISIANANPGNVTSFGSPATCGPFLEDNQYSVTVPSGFTFHLPNGQTVAGNGQTLNFIGIRPFSSPACQLDGTSCTPDAIPVFSNIFAQDTIANSAYNSFQADLEKRFSHGLQLQAAYTFSKSMDQASSFEDLINPFNPRASRSLSLFDARHRLVISYYYLLPIPKYSGLRGGLLSGWAVSGITQFQSGFPVHIQDGNDHELTSSIDFSAAGTPDLVAPFHRLDPRDTPNHLVFDPASFSDNFIGRFGTARRTICCGPGLNNSDVSVQKEFLISESKRMEFRWDVFNVANHTHFYNIDGNITDGSNFGVAKKVADPRLMQFALKFYF